MIKKNLFSALLFKPFLKISKRHRFIIAAIVSAFFVLLTTFFSFNQLRFYLPPLSLLIYFLSYFALLERINKAEWLTLFILPVYFTLSLVLFYFLLPVRWLTRFPLIVIYSISIYAILLASNIFNVGVEKSLQLFRAAFSINFLFITVSSFLSYSLLLSFKNNFLVNFIGVFLLTYPLAYQFIWTVSPEEDFSLELAKLSFIISFLIAQLALFCSFIPLKTNVFALLLTTGFYSLLGIVQAYLEERVFKERIREFIIVFGFVLVIALLSAGWP